VSIDFDTFWEEVKQVRKLLEPKPDDIVLLIFHPLDAGPWEMKPGYAAPRPVQGSLPPSMVAGVPVETDDWSPRGQVTAVLHKQKQRYDHYRALGFRPARAILRASLEVPAGVSP